VFGDGGLAECEWRHELGYRRFPGCKSDQDRPARWVRERGEDLA
jgi:hypothetical protein